MGDLVLLQNQRTKRWDCPATVHLVRPGNRSAYVVAEDDGQMYLRSHTFLRLRQPEDSAVDAVPDPDSGTVSSTSDDIAPGSQASITLVHPDSCEHFHRMTKLWKAPTSEPDGPTRSVLHRGTRPVQLRGGPEEEGQIFFSHVNTLTAQPTKETSPAKATLQKQASSLIAAAGRPHPPTPFASPQTETTTMSKIKVILISLATLVALALAVVAAVKLLSDISSEEIEVVEPYGELHQGPKLFDFSNMKVAGSSTLIILRTLAAMSYFCRRIIISKLSRNQAPFVPSQPAAAAPSTSCRLQPGHRPGTAPRHQLPDTAPALPWPSPGFLQHPAATACHPPQPQLRAALQQDPLQWRPRQAQAGPRTAPLLPHDRSSAPLLQRGHGHGGSYAEPRPECSQSCPGPGH